MEVTRGGKGVMILDVLKSQKCSCLGFIPHVACFLFGDTTFVVLILTVHFCVLRNPIGLGAKLRPPTLLNRNLPSMRQKGCFGNPNAARCLVYGRCRLGVGLR